MKEFHRRLSTENASPTVTPRREQPPKHTATSRHTTAFGAAIAAALCMHSIPAAALLGGGKSGNEFNYEACAKIKEGETTYQEAEEMLEGEPISTGKSAAGFFRHYQFEQSGGLSLRSFGVSVGGSKGKSYKCFLIHNSDGIVTAVDMQEIGVDGSSTGI